jgi:predicted permease
MLKSYIKLAIRNIRRSASYSIINISGLALGITCALLIFSLVTYHLGFDNFHDTPDRVYRFVTEQHRDQISYAVSVPPAFGKQFREDYTYGEKVARVCTASEVLISFDHGNDVNKFVEDVAFADPEFFEIFNYPPISGNIIKILSEPNKAVITERIAKKYFGNEIAIGKTLRLQSKIEFVIAGILKDIPDNTDFRSEIYFSYITVGQFNEWYAADDSWGGITTDIQTFTRLHKNITPSEVEAVLPAYVKKYRAESKNVHHYKLQPLNDIHFNPDYQGVMDRNTLIILSVIGFFLIFTACLNFINLATAQAVTRSKEVGVRKTLGSIRAQLFWQFTLETAVIVGIATTVALAFAYAILPFVNELFNTRVRFDLFTDIRLLIFIPALMIVVTLLSSMYPGLILSGFKPVLALKGKLTNTGNFNIRRTLITAQFTISQILLIGLIVVMYQMHYFKKADMGFDQDAMVIVPVGSNDQKTNMLKDRLAQLPNVQHVTACFVPPSSQSRWGTSLTYDNRTEGENFAVSFRGGDENYLSTFGLVLVAGRNVLRSDTVREFVVNEKFVEKLSLQSPEEILGKNIRVNGDWTGPVVGVVKDFHDLSLHADISPIFITTTLESYQTIALKINMKDSKETLAAIEKEWSAMYPDLLYSYDFLDNLTAEFYETEQTMLTLVQAFSFIALFIGCMGLYGLVSFMGLQKTKEIGIRKVLGGSVSQILWIFGKEFSRLILIAFFIAAPIGWYLMSKWLEEYVFHVDMTAWIFVIELIIIGAFVMLTVGYQSAKSALMNPVKALRTE